MTKHTVPSSSQWQICLSALTSRDANTKPDGLSWRERWLGIQMPRAKGGEQLQRISPREKQPQSQASPCDRVCTLKSVPRQLFSGSLSWTALIHRPGCLCPPSPGLCLVPSQILACSEYKTLIISLCLLACLLILTKPPGARMSQYTPPGSLRGSEQNGGWRGGQGARSRGELTMQLSGPVRSLIRRCPCGQVATESWLFLGPRQTRA